jgi:hypothetical protein
MRGFVRTKSLSRFGLATLAGASFTASALGCGGGSPSNGAAGTSGAAGATGLVDGAHLTASLVIPSGMTVTIPPGATIVADPMVTVTVQGVLVVGSATGTHARIAATVAMPDMTQRWGGLIVDTGGDLEAQGLDLAGATTALEVRPGSTAAHYDIGTISAPSSPFQIDTGGRLDTAHAVVVGATSGSTILGQLHASYLDYQTSGFSDGLVMMDPTAIFDVTDSTFHGAEVGGGDYIVSYAASLIHVAYSTINQAHCAFHFNDVTQFEIDHVTAGAASPGGAGNLNVYGAMLYGSGAGPNTISNSNFVNPINLDQMPPNGPLTITNTYTTGNNAPMPTWTWLPADVATAPIADAKPR